MTKVKVLCSLLFITCLVLLPVSASIINNQGTLLQLDEDIDQLELSTSEDQIELGNSLTISYGFLNNESQYLSNITYYLILFFEEDTIDQGLINNGNFTYLIDNGTTTGTQELLNIDSAPTDQDPFKTGEYTVYLTTNITTTTVYNSSVSFEIFPQEGASVEVSFSDSTTLEEIESQLEMDRGEQKTINITLTNLGFGNAVNLIFSLEGINNPVQVESSGLSDGLQIPSLIPSQRVNIEITVIASDFGIGGLEFSLIYDKNSGLAWEESHFLEILILPNIQGNIDIPNESFVGESVPIEIIILNTENENFTMVFYLSSTNFLFTPTETQIEIVPNGISTYEYSALTSLNGTFEIKLYMIFIENQAYGNDQYIEQLNSIIIEIITPEEEGETIYQQIIVITSILLTIILIGLLINKSIRDYLIIKIRNSAFIPDIKFSKKKVVIDGSNVAWEALDDDGKPKIDNILMGIETLKKYGFEEIVVVADAALRYQIKDAKDLDSQSKTGKIKVLPAKVDGDSFILRLSRDMGALILTNDLYREYRDEFPWIDKRRIPYSILDSSFYLHPIYDLQET